MKPLTALVFILISHLSFSQSRDELFAQLDTAQNDTTILDLYQKLARSYQGRNKDSTVKYSSMALVLAQEMKYPKATATSLNIMGITSFLESNYDTALYFCNEGLKWAKIAGDSLQQGALLSNIGMVLTYQGKYDTSIQVLLKARALRELLDDPKLSSTINNLGNAYFRISAYDQALEYYKEAAELKELHNQTRSLSNTLNNIGIILKNQGKYEEAIPYYKRSLEIAEEFDDIPKQAFAHNNLATLYQDGGISQTQSEFHFKRAIEKKIEIGDKASLFNSLMNYAELLSDMGRSREALAMLEQAETLEAQIGENSYTLNGLLMKARVLADLDRFEEAYAVHRNAYVKRVDEINEDRNKKITEWEAKYESAKKEAEIERLAHESALQKTEIANFRLIATTIGIATVIILGLLIAFYAQRLKKKRAEQQAQELQIEALEKRLIDLNISPSQPEVTISDLNEKINTPLSDREFEVLKLSLDGKTNTEIAEHLFVSISTVKFHLRNTYGKLGVSNRKEALVYVAKKS